MLDQKLVFDTLAKHGVTFFTGVPDSYLNGFCNYALANVPERNVIAANEGNAVGIACGHYFATKEIPLVYMQNSGLGNTINPLASLADKDVYAVPMLLLIGWRGQGNTEPNHPQHKLQGEITPALLDVMHIPYSILTDDNDDFQAVIEKAVAYCKENRQPYGLISPKGVMAASEKANNVDDVYPMSREEAIEVVLSHMPADTEQPENCSSSESAEMRPRHMIISMSARWDMHRQSLSAWQWQSRSARLSALTAILPQLCIWAALQWRAARHAAISFILC